MTKTWRAAVRSVMLAAAVWGMLAVPARAQTPEVQKILAEIKANDKGMLAVSEEDGRFLRLMIASSGAKHALEIGGASGYSAIWIGIGLRETGGKLVTIEYDPVRAKELAENIRRAGLADIVQVVAGDAFQQIPKVAGTFDFVFLDAWKKDYKRSSTWCSPRLRRSAACSSPTTSSTSAARWGISSTRSRQNRPLDDDRVAVG